MFCQSHRHIVKASDSFKQLSSKTTAGLYLCQIPFLTILVQPLVFSKHASCPPF